MARTASTRKAEEIDDKIRADSAVVEAIAGRYPEDSREVAILKRCMVAYALALLNHSKEFKTELEGLGLDF